jgi:hypothetical protein
MNVIVCFSSMPSRIGKTELMVKSIIEQTFSPSNIFLFLPDICVREGKSYDIPSWIENSGIVVVRTDKDYGPGTKLIPALTMDLDPDTLIITVDDDIVYERHMIEELVSVAENVTESAIGFLGIGSGYVHGEYIPEPHVPIPYCLGGYRGIGYRRRFFDYEKLMEQYETFCGDGICAVDDQLFCTHIKKRGYGLAVAKTNYPKRYNKDEYIQRGFPYDFEHNGEVIGLNFVFLDLGNGLNDENNVDSSMKELKRFDDLLIAGEFD